MHSSEKILERWLSVAAAVYPDQTAAFVISEGDRFRNPVGYVLRENLLCIVREVIGNMDQARLQSAMEAVIRVRAVQALSEVQAVGFVFQLRGILNDVVTGLDKETVTGRIDMLALLAFEEYVRCRERLSEIRLNESLRALAVPAAMVHTRE
jgi:hypothetical protein